MKRLTEHRYKGTIVVDMGKHHESAIRRLAAIEDILGDEYEPDEISKIVRCEDCVYMVGRAEFPGECYCKILADTVPFGGFCHRGKAALKAREQDG